MNGNGRERLGSGIDPNSAEAAVGGIQRLGPPPPGVRRIATIGVAVGSAYVRPEGSPEFYPVKKLGSGFGAGSSSGETTVIPGPETPVVTVSTPERPGLANGTTK